MPRKAGWTDLEKTLLRFLASESSYAFSIAESLGVEKSSAAVALKRFQGAGLVRSKWDTSEGRPGPPRRVYSLTAKGRREHAKIMDSP